MTFYSATNRPQTIAYPKSEKIIPTFGLKIGKDGKKELQQTGTTNLYEKIQASKEQTLIYNVLERYNNGELDVLNKSTGMYGDFTNLPTSLAEAQQKIIDAENTFNTLPLEVRKEFNHSVTEFLASFSNGNFEKVIKKLQKVETPTTEQTTQVTPAVETASAEVGGNT